MPNRSWSENLGSLLNGGCMALSALWLLEARVGHSAAGNPAQVKPWKPAPASE